MAQRRPKSAKQTKMEKRIELVAKRGEKVEALAVLIEKMGADDYEETEVDQQVYDELKKDIDGLDKKIKRAEEVNNLKASLARPIEGQIRLPAEPRKRMTKLKAFVGENAEENAYRVGKWIWGFVLGNEEARSWCRENGMVVKAEGEGTNVAGGFLVPTPMMNAIIDLREQFGVFRQNAQVVPMSSDTLYWPRRVGGLLAFFTAEGTAISESTAAWDNVNLVAKKLAALTRISTELSEDAVVSVADLMTQEIAYAFASKEDDCGFNGDGTSTFGGIRGITTLLTDGGHSAGLVAAASGHSTFATLDNVDITKLMGALPQYALARAKFYTSALGFATAFERLVAIAGGNSINTLDGSVMYRYLGFPIVISQKLPVTSGSLATKVGILFGDLALAAALGERRVATIRRSDDRYFEFDQIGILGTERVDIVCHDLGDTVTAGPIVGLQLTA